MEQRVCDVIVKPDREKRQSSLGGLNSIRTDEIKLMSIKYLVLRKGDLDSKTFAMLAANSANKK